MSLFTLYDRGFNYRANSAVFNGTDTYINSTASSMDMGDVVNTSFWIKVTSLPATNHENVIYLSYTDGSTTEYVFMVGVHSTGAIRISAATAFTDEQLFSSVTVADGAWHHVFVTHEFAQDGLRMVIDGDVSNLVTADGIALTTQGDALLQANVGSTVSLGGTPSQFLDGELAEVYIDTRDLTADDDFDKFIANGKPLYLGENGENPAGFSPLVYFNQPVPNFDVNQGTSPNWTEFGTLTAGSTPHL